MHRGITNFERQFPELSVRQFFVIEALHTDTGTGTSNDESWFITDMNEQKFASS